MTRTVDPWARHRWDDKQMKQSQGAPPNVTRRLCAVSLVPTVRRFLYTFTWVYYTY